MKKYFGRVNHVNFMESTSKTTTSSVNGASNYLDLTCVDNMVLELAVQLFSNVDTKIHFNIDMKSKSVRPDDDSLNDIQASLRGDEILERIQVNEGDISVQNDDEYSEFTNDSSEDVNINRVLDDFTILDLNDSDDDSDYEPEESDSESDSEDCLFGNNIADIEKRVYGAPNDSKYD